MSVTSVSSSSDLWSLYENQRAQQRKRTAFDPGDLIRQLEELKDDPEQLKAKAAELYEQVAKAAESADGDESEMLGRIAADLATVAENGDLSVMQNKMPPPPGAGNDAPNGSDRMSVGGLDGSQSALMKWIEALLDSDDEDSDDDLTLNSPEELQSRLKQLKESNADKFLSTVTKLAEEARKRAEKASGGEAEMLNLLAADLEDAAATGDLTAMEGHLAEKSASLLNNRNIGGYDSSKAISMLYLQAQISAAAQRLSA